MKKSQRMTPVMNIAKDREREAALALVAYQRAADRKKERLAELESYRAEYVARLAQINKQGTSVSRMQDFRVFIQKLDIAIVQQRRAVFESEREYEERRREWSEQRGRAQALEKYIGRARGEEKRVEEKRDQKEADERAQRTSRRARSVT